MLLQSTDIPSRFDFNIRVVSGEGKVTLSVEIIQHDFPSFVMNRQYTDPQVIKELTNSLLTAISKAWPQQFGMMIVKEANSTGVTLLDAAQLAYRKHHLDDPDIGWDELSEQLYLALTNAMGDQEFIKWLAQYSKNGADRNEW